MPVDIKPEEALTSEQEPLKWAITDGVATPNIFYNGHAVQVQDFNTVATVKYGGKRARPFPPCEVDFFYLPPLCQARTTNCFSSTFTRPVRIASTVSFTASMSYSVFCHDAPEHFFSISSPSQLRLPRQSLRR